MKLRVILFVILNLVLLKGAQAGDFLESIEFQKSDGKQIFAKLNGSLGGCQVIDFEVEVGTNKVLNCPTENQPHRRYFVAVKKIHMSLLKKIEDNGPESVKGYEITSTEYNDDPNKFRLTPGAWR